MFTVILDNGHGSNTLGKRSPKKEDGSRLFEYEYAREVVKVVAAKLKGLGYRVEILVPEEIDVPLSERVRRINNIVRLCGASNCVMVSIHLNAAGSNDTWMSARGWSAWTTKGQNNSDKLAECLYDYAEIILLNDKEYVDSFKGQSIQRPIRKDITDGDRDLESNFYITKGANCPAVLTENLFQDNRLDVAYLESRKGFNNIVDIHVRGIDKWFKNKK